jgi:carboxypeptidase PM20D1
MIIDLLIPLAIVLGVILLFLVGFMMLKTVLFSPKQKSVKPRSFVEVDGQSVAERLGLAVQFKTISNPDQAKIDPAPFLGLQRLFKTLYPQVHNQLTLEIVNDYSLLYTWEGKNPSLKPIMLTAHQDVVPADESEESDWLRSPFSGEVADGYVWGRGAIDDKNGVIGIMEAVEYLLKHDFKPERTVYIGFGHDEEVGGKNGAGKIVELLTSRGVELDSLLDEGGMVTTGFFPGIESPLGMIGISEKGYLSLRLSVERKGGHSATPPQETAIGILSRAIASLESQPMPAHLEVVEFLMSYLGSELPFFQRMMFANTWLFNRLLKKRLATMPELNARMRTTTAPTIIKAGVKDNILPSRAEAIINFRIFPGDDLRSVYEMVQERIGDERVKMEPFTGDVLEGDSGWNPSPVADTESPYFIKLTQLIKEAFPGTLTAPYLVAGATDSRYYGALTNNAFRFFPSKISNDELRRMHGVNERLSIENCAKMVSFYIAYIEELSNLPGEDQPLVESQHVEVDQEEDLDDYLVDIPEEFREGQADQD